MLQTVMKMIHQQERGVLVTVIAAEATLCGWVGRHWIWRDQQSSPDFEEVQSLLNSSCDGKLPMTSLLNAELERHFRPLCKQSLEHDQFRRERVRLGEGWLDLMLEPIAPRPRLIVLGCGHVGQAVARMADWAGWPLTVVDDRPDFAHPGLFPAGTKVVCGDFTATIQHLNPMETDYVVIVTRGHQYDRTCLEAFAGRSLAYVGMIGSRRRVQGLMEELTKNGVDEQWLRLVHSPIGLKIGAETPEEIAVSIVAEMIQVRRKGASR